MKVRELKEILDAIENQDAEVEIGQSMEGWNTILRIKLDRYDMSTWSEVQI